MDPNSASARSTAYTSPVLSSSIQSDFGPLTTARRNWQRPQASLFADNRQATLLMDNSVNFCGSLGYRDVLWKTLSLQSGIFTAFAAATFLILFGSFLALKRAHRPNLPSGHTIFIGGQPVKLPVEPVLRLIALGLS